MSTIPTEDAWTDAGLVPPEEVEVPLGATPDRVPDVPRPDLRDEAAEPDVVEQALLAGEDDDEDAYADGS